MTHPGSRLRTVAARWYDTHTMDTLIDPAIADLQAEYAVAAAAGRPWPRRRAWVLGHVAFAKLVGWIESRQVIHVLRHRDSDDHRTLARTMRFSGVMMTVSMILLILPFLGEDGGRMGSRMIALLLPQAVPLAVPVGLAIGTIWGLGLWTTSRHVRAVVLMLAIAWSGVSFATLAWMMPMANQAWRVARAERQVLRGERELSLTELKQFMDGEADAASLQLFPSTSERAVAREYYKRWSLACAPFVLAVFGMCLTRRGRQPRLRLGLAGAGAVWAYYLLMFTARGATPIIVEAWIPNAVFLLLSLALLRMAPPPMTTLTPLVR